jgi:hypothetical protein
MSICVGSSEEARQEGTPDARASRSVIWVPAAAAAEIRSIDCSSPPRAVGKPSSISRDGPLTELGLVDVIRG